MQLGNNLYVDLEISGLEQENLIEFLDLVSIKIVETAGASLPYLYMAFITRDSRVKNFVQENNTMKVTLGNNPENSDTFSLTIFVANATKDGMGGWLIEFSGFLQNSSYMVDQINKAYLGNSLIVTNKIMKDYFGRTPKKGKGSIFESDLHEDLPKGIKEKGKKQSKKYYLETDFKRVNEAQVIWRRRNQTACTFVAETLLHCDVRPSFPLFSFDKYGQFYVKDLQNLIKEGPKYRFVPREAETAGEIQYCNDFNVEDFKDNYNLYSGFNKITEIYGVETGMSQSIVSKNEPILAATSLSESSYSGSMVSSNNMQSSNVHKTYTEAFVHNTNKLISMSSMLGCLRILGPYYKDLKPLDLVYLELDSLYDSTMEGLYLVDTILTEADPSTGGINTLVYVTRDNKNNVENYVEKKKKRNWLKIKDKFFNTVARAVHQLSTAYSMCLQFVDGTYMDRVRSFMVQTKTNLLRSFSIAGVKQDFTGQIGLLKTLILAGNSLMNTLIDMIFPEDIAYTLRDFIIRKPTLIGLISSYVAEYVPAQARYPIMFLIESLFSTTDSLNSIAKDNDITLEEDIPKEEGESMTDTSERDYIEESQGKINYIITDFENNTTGLDIPFPIINLTESQAVLPEEDLRNYVAVKTIDNLTDLNYLDGVDKEKFKEILLGEEAIDFSIIDKINKNVGNTMSYRLWGTFESLIELTDFYIKKSYKDRYKTLPCTKLISAIRNKNIFFACPKKETDLRFYINSNRTILKSFDINLGYKDIYGSPLPYVVYYTEDGFNSNSVLFEVKQGGMV